MTEGAKAKCYGSTEEKAIRETSYWRCPLNWTWKGGDGLDIMVLNRTQGEPIGGLIWMDPSLHKVEIKLEQKRKTKAWGCWNAELGHDKEFVDKQGDGGRCWWNILSMSDTFGTGLGKDSTAAGYRMAGVEEKRNKKNGMMTAWNGDGAVGLGTRCSRQSWLLPEC